VILILQDAFNPKEFLTVDGYVSFLSGRGADPTGQSRTIVCTLSEHNLMGTSTRRCPAVSKSGGIVLSQCGAACV
jgi:hypothetical protein